MVIFAKYFHADFDNCEKEGIVTPSIIFSS